MPHETNGPSTLGSERFLYPFSQPFLAAGLILLTAAALAIFNRAPALDLMVSEIFYDPETRTFPVGRSVVWNDIRDFFHLLPLGIAIPLLISAIIISARKIDTLRRFALGVFVASTSFLVSSLFVVNLWLKEESGRPRPQQTDLFGGNLSFVPAGRFTDYCPTNCSFVSGESSAAFWLVTLTAVVPARWRMATFLVTTAIAVFVAGLRVSFGAHYLSDVTIAGLLSLTIFSILATTTACFVDRAGLAGGSSTVR